MGNHQAWTDVQASTTVNKVAGVAFYADDMQSGYPGTAVAFAHTLENSGNGEDTFSFSYISSKGWAVSVPGPVTLASGDSQLVEVVVTVPSGALPGVIDETIVTVTSAFDDGVTAQVTNQTAVKNTPPTFNSDPISKANATTGVAYNESIENDATDLDGHTLTFSKVSGPAWLTVAPGGALSGTPSSSDVGDNSWTVEVDDGNGGTDQAVLQITVISGNAPPAFTSDPVVKPDATVNAPYSGTLAADATDPNGDTLTFSKVSGPAWLTIAPDGALSGTPSNSDVGPNSWTIKVDDGNGGSDQATLQITVTQHLLYLPILRSP